MNFFDFATLARKKGGSFFNNSLSFNSSVSNHVNDQRIKVPSSNDCKGDQKVFDLIKTMNDELDRMLDETEQNNSEIDKIIGEFSHLNQNMENLFGEVITDLKNQA